MFVFKFEQPGDIVEVEKTLKVSVSGSNSSTVFTLAASLIGIPPKM